MEPTSASRFANALSLGLIQEHGWAEVSIGDPPPYLRLVAHPLGGLLLIRGDGLTSEEISSIGETCRARFEANQFPSTWRVLGLLFVFEAGATPEARAAVANQAKSKLFSTRRVLAGTVDLLDGTTDFKGETRLSVSGTLTRVLSEWRAGEGRVDTTVYRAQVQAEVDRTQAFVGRLAKTRPWGTWAIFLLCAAMFAWTEASGGSTRGLTLLRFGADYGPLVRQGEWWRLVGAMFLHIGILHLVVNMFSLFSVGSAIERYFGNGRYLALYLLAGVGGAATSAAMKDNLSAGASGAIFGLFGAAALLGIRYRREIPPALRKRIAGGMFPCIVYNLVYGLSHQNIDNSAHIGGLIVGSLFAAIIPPAVTEGEETAVTDSLTKILLAFGLSMFAIEGYVGWRAIRYPDLASVRTWTYRDPKRKYEVTLPAPLRFHSTEEADNFLAPGLMEFQVFVFHHDEAADVATEAAAIIEALKQAGVSVTGHQVRSLGGREWLLVDALLGEIGPARFAIAAEGNLWYRLRILAGSGGFEEAKLVLDRILEGFRTISSN